MRMPVQARLFVIPVFLLALVGSAPAASPVPDVALRDLSGRKQHLKDLRGSIVVLNFWATWCGPCQQELPVLSQLRERYAGQPVHFVAISIDEHQNRAGVAAFLAQRGVTLDTWTGGSPETMAKVGLKGIVPGTLILDPRGDAVFRITGQARKDDLRSRLDWLLDNHAGPEPDRDLNRS